MYYLQHLYTYLVYHISNTFDIDSIIYIRKYKHIHDTLYSFILPLGPIITLKSQRDFYLTKHIAIKTNSVCPITLYRDAKAITTFLLGAIHKENPSNTSVQGVFD